MLFLVELDHVKSGITPTVEESRTFMERIVFPTLAQAEQLVAEKKILAGGVVAGRVADRFIVDVSSPQEVDRIITSIPFWRVAETKITPLIAFADRRAHIKTLLNKSSGKPED